MKKLTGFGMAMTGLLSIIVLAVIGLGGWFAWRFLRDTVLDGDVDVSPEDQAIRDANLAGCIDMARKLKGTGITYSKFTRIAPFCGTIVTPKIWGEL